MSGRVLARVPPAGDWGSSIERFDFEPMEVKTDSILFLAAGNDWQTTSPIIFGRVHCRHQAKLIGPDLAKRLAHVSVTPSRLVQKHLNSVKLFCCQLLLPTYTPTLANTLPIWLSSASDARCQLDRVSSVSDGSIGSVF